MRFEQHNPATSPKATVRIRFTMKLFWLHTCGSSVVVTGQGMEESEEVQQAQHGLFG